jgi:hypothetical protein
MVNIGVGKKLTNNNIIVITFFITKKEVIDKVNNLNSLLSQDIISLPLGLTYWRNHIGIHPSSQPLIISRSPLTIPIAIPHIRQSYLLRGRLLSLKRSRAKRLPCKEKEERIKSPLSAVYPLSSCTVLQGYVSVYSISYLLPLI